MPLSIYGQVICDGLVNLLPSDLRRHCQSTGKRFATRLSIYWQAICDASVNQLASQLGGDCQSTGK
jgi:hypothetical protein